MTQYRVYGVWCSVSGGATGDRQGWLRRDGKIVVYRSHGEAQAEARTRNLRTANHPRASFRYEARERIINEVP